MFPPTTSQPQTPWIPVQESSNNPCNKTENLNICPQISTQLSHNNPHSIITYLHLNLTFTFIISSQFPHIIPTAPSQTSHMHPYTIPTQLDTLKHHSDLPNRLQLDSVPEPYIYPLLHLTNSSQNHHCLSVPQTFHRQSKPSLCRLGEDIYPPLLHAMTAGVAMLSCTAGWSV